MNKTKLVLLVAALAVFVFAGSVVAKENNASEKVRVLAHGKETAKAVSLVCEVVRDAKTVKALQCPKEIAQSLSLQEDIRVSALKIKDDGEFSSQSVAANQQIGANLVQLAGNTGAGRKIVVLDTGYNYNHPELSSSYLGGKDFVNND